MIPRIVLSVCILAAAGAVRNPTTRIGASPVAARTPTTAPAAPATTQPAMDPRVAFARETIARHIEEMRRQQNAVKVAYIDLNREISESPARFVLIADVRLTLQNVISRLNQARDDKDIRAVVLNIGDTDFNLAQAQELRDAISALRRDGKRVFVYSDSYDTASYIAASASRDICLPEGGEIVIPGVSINMLFAKGLLDLIGVKADYVQIGRYKGADEQFTRTGPSREMRQEVDKILDGIFQQIVDGIACHRNISNADVTDMINGVFLPAKLARQRGFVDHLVDQDDLRNLLKKELSREIDLVHDYGLPQREPVDFSNPLALLSLLMKRPSPQEAARPSVALIYVEGLIVDGESGDSLFSGGEIGSEDLRKSLRVAVRDDSVKAIVLRVDSPGGSAGASEVIYQAVRRAAAAKPLVVSIGSTGASGGYYVACAGNYIFADPAAIVGSIGVVGGKFVLKDLFGKIGINTESFIRGNNADLFSFSRTFTEQQRRLVTEWMQRTYDQFVDRVMATRKGRIRDIDEVAHGRIFLAQQARALGMVDELGGLDKAIAHAARQAQLAPGSYDVRVIPSTKSVLDLLRGEDPDASLPLRPKIQGDMAQWLSLFGRSESRMLKMQLRLVQMMQSRPVALVAPYIFTIN